MRLILPVLVLVLAGCAPRDTKWESLTLSVDPPLVAGTLKKRLVIEDKSNPGSFFSVQRLSQAVNKQLSPEENCLRVLSANLKRSEISKVERTTIGRYEGVAIPVRDCGGVNTNCVVTVFLKESVLYRMDLVVKQPDKSRKAQLDALRRCWQSIR